MFNMFPVLISLLFIPVVFVPMFFLGPYALLRQVPASQPASLHLFITTNSLLAVLSLVFYVVSSASTCMAVRRVESGFEHQTFRDLFQDGLRYFWPVLGVTLLVGVTASVVFLLLFGCVLLAGMATRGLGLICLLPLFFFFYPALLLAYCLTEQSQAAVVVGKIGVLGAIVRGWSLVRAHIWKFLLVSLLFSIPFLLLGTIAGLPLAFPFGLLPLFGQTARSGLDIQRFGWQLIGVSLLVLPVLVLVQGIAMTFIKSTFMLLYLRLTHPTVSQTALQ
jgi:hypothetical protein